MASNTSAGSPAKNNNAEKNRTILLRNGPDYFRRLFAGTASAGSAWHIAEPAITAIQLSRAL